MQLSGVPQAKRVLEETEAEQAREREEASKADREKFEKEIERLGQQLIQSEEEEKRLWRVVLERERQRDAAVTSREKGHFSPACDYAFMPVLSHSYYCQQLGDAPHSLLVRTRNVYLSGQLWPS